MQLTKNLYDKLKQKKTWNSETVDEKLMVLQARMKTMQKDYKRKSHDKKSTPPPNTKGKKKDYSKGRNKTNDSDRDTPRNWPAPNDKSKTKTWRNRTYRYCDKSTGGKCNGKWVIHLAAICQGGDFLKCKYGNLSENPKGDTDKRNLRVKKALAATIHASSGSDSDSN